MRSFLLFAAAAIAAYVPSDPWTTLTPDTVLGPTTSYASTFGIQVVTLENGTPTATQPPASQITDGQVQETTATQQVVSQIGDGQIQQTTGTVQIVSQIGDGQIQATTATVVSQISDGQIQATTAPVVSQIGDGQIQATTATVVSQIGDGQIQATGTPVSQIGDGQIQHVKRDVVSCKSDSALSMVLSDTILTDSKGRIGSIVANRQFQFDGPPPQAGAIYAAGWSITEDGNLAIGNTTTFYQCLSGNFYNLYDESIGDQCHEVNLKIVDLVDC